MRKERPHHLECELAASRVISVPATFFRTGGATPGPHQCPNTRKLIAQTSTHTPHKPERLCSHRNYPIKRRLLCLPLKLNIALPTTSRTKAFPLHAPFYNEEPLTQVLRRTEETCSINSAARLEKTRGNYFNGKRHDGASYEAARHPGLKKA